MLVSGGLHVGLVYMVMRAIWIYLCSMCCTVCVCVRKIKTFGIHFGHLLYRHRNLEKTPFGLLELMPDVLNLILSLHPVKIAWLTISSYLGRHRPTESPPKSSGIVP